MNRREALKNIGLSAGYIAATPTIVSLLQSCQKRQDLDWIPKFLSIDEGKILDKIVDLIIPETDIPGAKSLHIPMFIDTYIDKVIEKDIEIKLLKNGAKSIVNELDIHENNSVDDIPIEAYDSLLTKYLKIPKEKQKENIQRIHQAMVPGNSENISQEILSFNFLNSVRELSIYGFKTSSEIGNNVLNYLPVPGEYIACDSVQNLTGGKDWAL